MNSLPDFMIPRKTAKRTSKQFSNVMDNYQPMLACWLLELTLSLGWYKKAKVRSSGLLSDEDFAVVTGIYAVESDDFDGEGEKIFVVNGKSVKHTDTAVRRILSERLTYFRKQPVKDSSHLLKNIDLLGNLIGLNDAEKAILCFATSLQVFRSLRSAISNANHKTTLGEIAALIAHIFGQSESDVLAGLRQDSTLTASGILELESHRDDLEDRLSLLHGISTLLTTEHESSNALIDRFLKRAGDTSLKQENFPHLTQDWKTLERYLAQSMRDREIGTNILLYGVPGTGKTEFVKAISMSLGADLYEISFSDHDGDPIYGMARLRAYNLCQKILCQKPNTILMFDEIEDVFSSSGGFLALLGIESSERGGKSSKAWINRSLERNATPSIWVTNDADIDPAYLRRFDYSVRFPVPPQKVRMEIARHHLKQFNPTEDWLSKVAANEQMTPAQYERAAKVARITSDGNEDQAKSLVELALDRSATLLGQKQMPARNTQYTGYDLRFANTSSPMSSIIAGLEKKRQGTFCFYGPAGTGKSELARHISDELGIPCVVRRASDILSKWVGGSEKNIAEMFAEARQQEAMLVLDEADSFLSDRRDAQRSWEVTQVNELLTQMEAFNGIFVCTTNLMDKLDQASLRRFAFKVKFDFLNPDQRWEMFMREYQRLGGNESNVGDWERQVKDINKLTPGDFSVAARQFSILDIPVTAAELYRQLREECRVKGGSSGKIGFVS